MQDDLFLSLTYGAVRGFTSDQVVLRSASPLVQIAVEAGATAVGPIDVELRNQHLQALLRVASVAHLDAEDLAGCPVLTGFEVDCIAATAAIGQMCESSGQCPEGLRCAAGTCEPSDSYSSCEAPDARRLEGQETSLQFTLPIDPCTRVQLETYLEPSADPLRFAVLGPTRDVDVISGLADEFRAANLDFVVLLGENAPSANASGLAELERVVTLLGTPAVVLAGPRELASQNGDDFLRRFGPHDHVWQIKGTRFFAFYSAYGTLGNRGLTRLEGFLNQLGDPTDESPLIGVTHVPPFDPNDLRDNSFRNDIEAMQVLSLLEQHGVHQLYAGGLGTGYDRTLDLETFVTTGHGTVTQPTREWMLVEIQPHGEGRKIGDLSVSSTRNPL